MTQVQKVLSEHDTEILLIHELIAAILSTHPNPEQVLTTFQAGVESLAKSAPDDIDPERIVELRARAAQHLIALRMKRAPSGSH